MSVSRYHRQTLLPQIGQAGQHRLLNARVLLIGCGALGSVVAEQLVRSGVGFLRLVDRDVVDLTNLQRQTLFQESDATDSVPKAAAASRRLAEINSEVRVNPVIADVSTDNILRLCDQIDLIIDGTDNVATRYLLNDVSIKLVKPWIYGACVGTEGRVMFIRPEATACLQCVFPIPPSAGELATCDTAGVLGPISAVVGSLQSLAAIKWLSGNAFAIADELLTFDLWANRIRAVSLDGARRQDCPCCGQKRFDFLDRPGDDLTSLCGRDTIQVRPRAPGKIDRAELQRRLAASGSVEATPFLLRFTPDSESTIRLTIFEDGRTLIHGTTDPVRAKSIVSRYVGS